MSTPRFLDEIGAKLSELAANSPVRDFEKNAKAMVSGLIGKLDVVTREEFDVQAELLRRTRERLQQLEARVEALEQAQSAARAGNSEHA